MRSNPANEYKIYTRRPSGHEEIVYSAWSFGDAASRLCEMIRNREFFYEAGIYGHIDDTAGFDPYQRYVASMFMPQSIRIVLMVRYKYGEFSGNDIQAVAKMKQICPTKTLQTTSIRKNDLRDPKQSKLNRHGRFSRMPKCSYCLRLGHNKTSCPKRELHLKLEAHRKLRREGKIEQNARKRHIEYVNPFPVHIFDTIELLPGAASNWEGIVRVDISHMDWVPKWMKPAFVQVQVQNQMGWTIDEWTDARYQVPIEEGRPMMVYSIESIMPRPRKAKEWKMTTVRWREVVRWLKGEGYPVGVLKKLEEELDKVGEEREWRKKPNIKIYDVDLQWSKAWEDLMSNATVDEEPRRNVRKRRITSPEIEITLVEYLNPIRLPNGTLAESPQTYDLSMEENDISWKIYEYRDPSAFYDLVDNTINTDRRRWSDEETQILLRRDEDIASWAIEWDKKDRMKLYPTGKEIGVLTLDRFNRIISAYGLDCISWEVNDEDLSNKGEIDILTGFVPPMVRSYLEDKLKDVEAQIWR